MTKTMKLTYTALFAALATILMQFEFMVPFMPPFLKIDLSGVAILIGAFMLGIGPGIAMTLVKDVIHAMMTQTGGVGELQDFLLLSLLVVVSVTIYRRFHTRTGALIGCLAGTAAMSFAGMLTNYFFIIPFYSRAMKMPIEAILASDLTPHITGMTGYLLFGVLPFNLIKGGIITLAVMLVYKKLSVFLRSKQFGRVSIRFGE